MTEDERAQLRATKAEATARLAEIDLAPYCLGVIDPRLEGYVQSVIAEPQYHNLFEQLAVERFLRMMERYGFDNERVQRFYYFYEHLYFPGKNGMQNYALTPVQCFQFANIFGFWKDGKRVIREAVLYVPRKFSKTTSSAALAVYDLLYGDANAEAYVGANSQLQAKVCFDIIRGCVRRIDPGGVLYRVNEDVIKSCRPDRTAIAQSLTASARTKDGLNASTVIMDEFSQARDNSLLTVLTTSMGIRENPLTVIITTASDVFDGPFYEMLGGYKRVLLGEFEDDSLFAHLFEPDVDDHEDDEITWRKVQPHMGVTVSMDFYRQEYKNAVRNGAEAMLAFRTKLLNVYAEDERRAWISATEARAASMPISLAALPPHMPAMVAFDLSSTGDFSAVTTMVIDPQTKVHYFHTAYFFPEGALSKHPNERLYRKWASEGYLKLTKGMKMDYTAIAEYILGLHKYVDIYRIGYDRWRADTVTNILESAIERLGSDPKQIIKDVPQTYGYFTSPVMNFEAGMSTGHVKINDNPINYYCFGNAVLDEGTLENVKPVKRQDNGKIDGVITMLMCVRLELDWRG